MMSEQIHAARRGEDNGNSLTRLEYAAYFRENLLIAFFGHCTRNHDHNIRALRKHRLILSKHFSHKAFTTIALHGIPYFPARGDSQTARRPFGVETIKKDERRRYNLLPLLIYALKLVFSAYALIFRKGRRHWFAAAAKLHG